MAPRVRWAALIGALLCLGAAPEPRDVDLKALLADKPAPSLAAYRLFTDPAGRKPNFGLTPYALNTPLFSDEMESVVFSPYWNIPDSIAQGETLPATLVTMSPAASPAFSATVPGRILPT